MNLASESTSGSTLVSNNLTYINMAKIRWQKWNRLIHYWGALACAIPVLIVLGTGIILLLKKESTWIQPASTQGSSDIPSVRFEQVLASIKTVEQAEIKSWDDIKLLDVRPSKGIIKVRAKNRYEIQVDSATGEVLQVAFRRSDLIEEIHDGSYFHDNVKLWIFLPSAIILFVLWVTGIAIFTITQMNKYKRQKKKRIKQRDVS